MSPKNMSKNDKAQGSGKSGRGNRKSPGIPTLITPKVILPGLIAAAAQPTLATVVDASGKVRTFKKWCFDKTPIHLSPDHLQPSEYLNKGFVVELTGQKKIISTADFKTSWSEVAYKICSKPAETHWVTGWVNDAYLDDYNEKFSNSGVVIPNPTADPFDAQQYMMLEGKARYNMCGELCAAFLVNDEIDSVLGKWKLKSPGTYNKVLAGGRDSGTDQSDLNNMLAAILGEYGYASDRDLIVSFKEKLSIPLSPARMVEDLKKMLVTHSLIVLVTINRSGEPIGKENPEIQHWIVLDNLTRNGSRVEIYNPFPNARQEYSFNEFYLSCRLSLSGVWVKRKHARPTDPVESLPTFKVAIATPNPKYSAAQYLDIDGKKKTQLCGEFCVAFIVKESIDAVLQRWKEVQPNLYAAKVGNNKGTGPFDLNTILKSYGYNHEDDVLDFSAGLTDPYTRKSLPSPGRMAKMLETHFLIAGVNIDGLTGKLKPGKDVPHWVVVDKITPVGRDVGGNGGWVELYNPFLNSWEEYSYKEFTNSAGLWSGLWVKRNVVPSFTPQVVVVPTIEGGDRKGRKPRKNGRAEKWTERQLLDAIRQKSKNEKSTNKIAAALVEKSGWKKKDIIGILNKMIPGAKIGKLTEAQLRVEFEKRRKGGKPVNKIVAELAGLSGWKKRDIMSLLKQTTKAGSVEKWTEQQLLTAIMEKFKNTKSVKKISAALVEISGWKNREIIKLFKTIADETKAKNKNKHQNKLGRLPATEPEIVVDPQTIIQASNPLAEFEEWQRSLLAAPGSKVRQVLRFGDDVLVAEAGRDTSRINTSNFQAVGPYNKATGFGAVSNYIKISHEDVMRLKAMQIKDDYEDERADWRTQKMNWLCKHGGTIYFFDKKGDKWRTADFIRWGTLVLGGNLVQVEAEETITVKVPGASSKRPRKMARLKGFRASDWKRPLDELLAEGLVHRCFCAYKRNKFGDSPKGIIYSPFFSLRDWDFVGKHEPTALYIPVEWLKPKVS